LRLGERARILEMATFQEERTREPSGNSLAGGIDHVFLEQYSLRINPPGKLTAVFRSSTSAYKQNQALNSEKIFLLQSQAGPTNKSCNNLPAL